MIGANKKKIVIVDKFKLVKIQLERNPDTKLIIKRILETCNLSTNYIDKIKTPIVSRYDGKNFNSKTNMNSGNEGSFHGTSFQDEYETYYMKIKKVKQEKTLK